MRIERMEGVNMTRYHNHIGAAAGAAENQKKQAELQQMAAVGQRNDVDPPLK